MGGACSCGSPCPEWSRMNGSLHVLTLPGFIHQCWRLFWLHSVGMIWWIYRQMDWVWSRNKPTKSGTCSIASGPIKQSICQETPREAVLLPRNLGRILTTKAMSGWFWLGTEGCSIWENDRPVLRSHHRNFALAQTIWEIKSSNKTCITRSSGAHSLTWKIAQFCLKESRARNLVWIFNSINMQAIHVSFCRVASKPKRHQIFMAPTPTEVIAEVRMCSWLS